MSNAARFIQGRLCSDAHFLYTAFAPMQANTKDKEKQKTEASFVLVKVGISTVPMSRLAAVHHGCPFRVAYAAFTPLYAAKRKSELVETRVLRAFREFRTRGEWLMLPNTEEVRGQFAFKTRAIISDSTGRPVEWTRVSANELAEYGPTILKRAPKPGR